jgi:hypothetical protein
MKKVKKRKVRDTWIPRTWSYRGAGYQKNQKKVIERKQKYKNKNYD